MLTATAPFKTELYPNTGAEVSMKVRDFKFLISYFL